VSRADHDRAYAELSKTGTFAGGKYTRVDSAGVSHTADALNAI
jgi:hypothetical protein